MKLVDLVLIAICSLLLVVAVALELSPVAVRVWLGLAFVLFFPGYSLVAALFPRRSDLNSAERLALSFALSLALVPLVGLLLNFSPWRVSLWPVLICVGLVIAACTFAAAVQRLVLPPGEAFLADIRLGFGPLRPGRVLFATSALIVASLVALAAAVYLEFSAGRQDEEFTEFYLLGSGGKLEDYPRSVSAGEEASVVIGLTNREGRSATYRIDSATDDASATLLSLSLADGERKEFSLGIRLTKPGERQRMDFLLFKDGDAAPYRSLRMFVDVTGPSEPAATVVDPTTAPPETRSPADEAPAVFIKVLDDVSGDGQIRQAVP